jgi:hypothetical protein
MKSAHLRTLAAAVAGAALVGGCSSWQTADRTEGTVVGAGGGAVAGAVVGGPVGAVVGGIGGGYVGYETTGYKRTDTAATTRTVAPTVYDSSTVRAAQQALNDRGFNAGPSDGQWGPATQDAVKRFQQASGLPVTGDLNPSTLSALGVS